LQAIAAAPKINRDSFSAIAALAFVFWKRDFKFQVQSRCQAGGTKLPTNR